MRCILSRSSQFLLAVLLFIGSTAGAATAPAVYFKPLDDSTVYVKFGQYAYIAAIAADGSDTTLYGPTGMILPSGTKVIGYGLDTLLIGADSGIARASIVLQDSLGYTVIKRDSVGGHLALLLSSDAGVTWDTLYANASGGSGGGITDAYDDLLADGDIGTGANQVAAGNHSHGDLHARSHAVTSTSDHTGTANRLLYVNSSGNVSELGFGTNGYFLRSTGTTTAPDWAAISAGLWASVSGGASLVVTDTLMTVRDSGAVTVVETQNTGGWAFDGPIRAAGTGLSETDSLHVGGTLWIGGSYLNQARLDSMVNLTDRYAPGEGGGIADAYDDLVSDGDIGTGSTQVAAGNHTHAQLHDRSHAMTSTSDHTATAWRLFYSNGSGNVTELALGSSGTYLRSTGTASVPDWAAVSAGLWASVTGGGTLVVTDTLATLKDSSDVTIVETQNAGGFYFHDPITVGAAGRSSTDTLGVAKRLYLFESATPLTSWESFRIIPATNTVDTIAAMFRGGIRGGPADSLQLTGTMIYNMAALEDKYLGSLDSNYSVAQADKVDYQIWQVGVPKGKDTLLTIMVDYETSTANATIAALWGYDLFKDGDSVTTAIAVGDHASSTSRATKTYTVNAQVAHGNLMWIRIQTSLDAGEWCGIYHVKVTFR